MEIIKKAGIRYKQGKPTCGMHAFANDLELHTGEVWTEEEIFSHWQAAGGVLDKKPGQGITGTKVCEYLKSIGKILDYKHITINLTPGLATLKTKHVEEDARDMILSALADPALGLLGGFFVYEDGDESGKFALDDAHFLTPPPLGTTVRGLHMMNIYGILKDVKRDGFPCVAIENQYGPLWGLEGICFMGLGDVSRLLREVWSISYPKHEKKVSVTRAPWKRK